MRTFILTGEINHEAFESFVQFCNGHEKEDMTIVLSSQGGDGDVGLAFFDFIQKLEGIVTAEAYGDVMSSAFLVFQACDVRLMAPYSRLMWHDAWDSFDGKFEAKQLRQKAKELDEYDRLGNIAISERLDIDISIVEGWSHAETYWTAPLALRDGLIDGYTRDMPSRPERSR